MNGTAAIGVNALPYERAGRLVMGARLPLGHPARLPLDEQPWHASGPDDRVIVAEDGASIGMMDTGLLARRAVADHNVACACSYESGNGDGASRDRALLKRA